MNRIRIDELNGKTRIFGVRINTHDHNRLPETPHKWNNMQHIDMSGNLPMGIAAKEPQVRYSAAYPTGRERIAKGTPLPCGPLYSIVFK